MYIALDIEPVCLRESNGERNILCQIINNGMLLKIAIVAYRHCANDRDDPGNDDDLDNSESGITFLSPGYLHMFTK